MRALALFLWALLVAVPAVAQTDKECAAYVIYREARGEGILTQRAVLDVLLARSKDSGMGICKVVRQPGQFPYAKDGIKKVDFYFTVRYNIVRDMKPVLPADYFYFNHVRHSFCRDTRKIGKLYFCR